MFNELILPLFDKWITQFIWMYYESKSVFITKELFILKGLEKVHKFVLNTAGLISYFI